MLQWYTTVNSTLNKYTIHAVDAVFLSLIKYHITGFGQVISLEMINFVFRAYGTINDNEIKENAVWIMGAYKMAKPLARLKEKIERVK